MWLCVLAGTAKIADVGLARIMQHTLSNTATGDPAGTFAYAAPEMLMGEKWDDKVHSPPPPPSPQPIACNNISCNKLNGNCVLSAALVLPLLCVPSLCSSSVYSVQPLMVLSCLRVCMTPGDTVILYSQCNMALLCTLQHDPMSTYIVVVQASAATCNLFACCLASAC